MKKLRIKKRLKAYARIQFILESKGNYVKMVSGVKILKDGSFRRVQKEEMVQTSIMGRKPKGAERAKNQRIRENAYEIYQRGRRAWESVRIQDAFDVYCMLNPKKELTLNTFQSMLKKKGFNQRMCKLTKIDLDFVRKNK